MGYSLETRRRNYFKINSLLAQLDNRQIHRLVGDNHTPMWQEKRNQKLVVGRKKIFLKRIPLTQKEHDNWLSTANYYRLPSFNNYGVGSAGLGVFREIIAHIKTTNWVLEGSTQSFPLLYHWRVIPFAGQQTPPPEVELRQFIRNWNGNKNIEALVRDKMAAPYEVLLFIEYIPHTLGPWLNRRMQHLPEVIRQTRQALDFLKDRGLIHFDCHYQNLLTDGTRVYLSDFGLTLDRSYDLSKTERDLFARNRYYDYGLFLACLSLPLHRRYNQLSPKRRDAMLEQCGLREAVENHHIRVVLTEYIDAIHADGSLRLEPVFLEAIKHYFLVIRQMQDFLVGLARNKKKNTLYSQGILRRHLRQCDFIGNT
jgi:serine/threonine protein kinase